MKRTQQPKQQRARKTREEHLPVLRGMFVTPDTPHLQGLPSSAYSDTVNLPFPDFGGKPCPCLHSDDALFITAQSARYLGETR